MKQTYIAILDCRDPRGRYWLSDTKRKLTDTEAAPYLIRARARLQNEDDTKARRMVHLLQRDGTEVRITWGEYLKRKVAEKRQRRDTAAQKRRVEK